MNILQWLVNEFGTITGLQSPIAVLVGLFVLALLFGVIVPAFKQAFS